MSRTAPTLSDTQRGASHRTARSDARKPPVASDRRWPPPADEPSLLKVSSSPHRRPLRRIDQGTRRRRACTARHHWSVFLLSHERRLLMAATRTPGITIDADGNYFIDKCHHGTRIP